MEHNSYKRPHTKDEITKKDVSKASILYTNLSMVYQMIIKKI